MGCRDGKYTMLHVKISVWRTVVMSMVFVLHVRGHCQCIAWAACALHVCRGTFVLTGCKDHQFGCFFGKCVRSGLWRNGL